MTQTLDDIRKKIDAVDDQIHDLLMHRAALIADVSEAKKKSGAHVVQPAREAMMIRRLLSRHGGPLPEAAIVSIWRELVGAVSLLQTGLKVSVTSSASGLEYCWDISKAYFGNVLPMSRSSSAIATIAALRDDSASFAVVPWPQDGEPQAWWPFLFNQEPESRMRVIVALPYGADQEMSVIHNKCLVVAKADFSSSGDDHSFIGLEVDHKVSRSKIIDVLKSNKLEPVSIFSQSGHEYNGDSIHLIETKGYVPEDDERLKTIAGSFEGHNVRCLVLGGFPVPPVYKPFKAAALEG